MSMIQVIYRSQPFGFDEAMLAGILFDARRCNARDGVTGALICRADVYLQLLEGPEAAVEAAYRRICADPRHLEVRPLVRRPIGQRLFPDWAMLDDPACSWMWSRAEVHRGALDRASEADVIAVFDRLACQPAH